MNDSDLLPLAAPTPGLYQHYKGGQYAVLGAVRHSETLESMTLYRALYGRRELWVRPSAMFTETVQVDGRLQPRFERIGDLPPDAGI